MPREDRNVAADLLARGCLAATWSVRSAVLPTAFNWLRPPSPMGTSRRALADLEFQLRLSLNPWRDKSAFLAALCILIRGSAFGFQKELYEEIFPQHNLGWTILWSTLKDPSHGPSDATLYEMIKEADSSALANTPSSGVPLTG